MTNDQIKEFRINLSNQRDSSAFKEKVASITNHKGAHRTIPSFKGTSLSLHSRSTKEQTDCANSRREIGIHSEDSPKYNSTHQEFCKIRRNFYKRSCEASTGRVSKEKSSWLRKTVKNKFISLTVLIDWATRRFLKSIASWSRIGLQILPESPIPCGRGGCH